jgi:hypothetical protein
VTDQKCEIRGPYCDGQVVSFDTPLKCCDNCFAYVGYRVVKPLPAWKRYWDALCLFSSIVWRVDMSERRMSARTAYSVAKDVCL